MWEPVDDSQGSGAALSPRCPQPWGQTLCPQQRPHTRSSPSNDPEGEASLPKNPERIPGISVVLQVGTGLSLHPQLLPMNSFAIPVSEGSLSHGIVPQDPSVLFRDSHEMKSSPGTILGGFKSVWIGDMVRAGLGRAGNGRTR